MKRRKPPHALLLLRVLLALPAGLGVGTSRAFNAIPPSQSAVLSFAGLAIGVPGEDLLSANHAGGLNIQYAAPGGPPTAGGQWFDQNQPEIIGSAEPFDNFGRALAVGDLNGDRCADLVVGVPGEQVGSENGAGGVNVLYGEADGTLSGNSSQWFDQNTPGIGGVAELGDGFGRALAVGDLNGDGYDDVAVGVPFEDIGTEDNAGSVNLIYGSRHGLSTTGSWQINQFTTDVIGSAESGDVFGSALAIGDLNGDGYGDLVVGVPGEQVGSAYVAGGVNVLYGTDEGLQGAGSQWFDQNHPDIIGTSEAGDRFGTAVAVADLNGDGYDDLAVGVPGEQVGQADAAGGVNVLYGHSGGLQASGSQWFDQNNPGVFGSAETSDTFGAALAVGDLNGDRRDDLAIGVPGEQVGTEVLAGGVNVLYGAPGSLSTGNSMWFDQRTDGISGTPEAGDEFGTALAIGDLNGDGYADLAVGVPYEGVGGAAQAGGVNLLYGSSDGLTTAGSLWFDQDTPGVSGDAESQDTFGYSLAIWPVRIHTTYLPLVQRHHRD